MAWNWSWQGHNPFLFSYMLVLTEDNFILMDRGAYNAQRYSVCHDMYFLYVKDKKRGEIFYPWVYFWDAHDGQGWVNPKPRGKNPVCCRDPAASVGTYCLQDAYCWETGIRNATSSHQAWLCWRGIPNTVLTARPNAHSSIFMFISSSENVILMMKIWIHSRNQGVKQTFTFR